MDLRLARSWNEGYNKRNLIEFVQIHTYFIPYINSCYFLFWYTALYKLLSQQFSVNTTKLPLSSHRHYNSACRFTNRPASEVVIFSPREANSAYEAVSLRSTLFKYFSVLAQVVFSLVKDGTHARVKEEFAPVSFACSFKAGA